ncbi:MAG: hypothetical protein GXP49_17965 [Deltaproteobacteria bacterium]|nr:hypothetical protein [Deltaproteobacteria bacterium]
MRFKCRSCGTLNEVAGDVPAQGRKVRCRGCGKVNVLKPKRQAKVGTLNDSPANNGGPSKPQAAGAISHRGENSYMESDSEEAPTRIVSQAHLESLHKSFNNEYSGEEGGDSGDLYDEQEDGYEPAAVVDYEQDDGYEPVAVMDYEQDSEGPGGYEIGEQAEKADETAAPLPANPELGRMLFSDSVMEELGNTEKTVDSAGENGEARTLDTKKQSDSLPKRSLSQVLELGEKKPVSMGKPTGHGRGLWISAIVVLLLLVLAGSTWWLIGMPRTVKDIKTGLDGLPGRIARIFNNISSSGPVVDAGSAGNHIESIASRDGLNISKELKETQRAHSRAESFIKALKTLKKDNLDEFLHERLDSAVENGFIQDALLYFAAGSFVEGSAWNSSLNAFEDMPSVNLLWRTNPGIACSAMTFMDGTDRLACVSEDNLLIFDLRSGKVQNVFHLARAASKMTFCEAKSVLAIADDHGGVRVLKPRPGGDMESLLESEVQGSVTGIAMSPDCNKLMAISGKPRKIFLIELKSGTKVLVRFGKNTGKKRSGVVAAGFVGSGDKIAVHKDGGGIDIISLDANGKVLADKQVVLGQGITNVIFSAPGKAVFVKQEDLYVVDFNNGKTRKLPAQLKESIQKLIMDSSGTMVVSLEITGRALLRLMQGETRVRVFNLPRSVMSLAVSRGGRELAWSTSRGEVVVEDVDKKRKLFEINGPSGALESVDFNPAGNELIASCSDGTIRAFSRDKETIDPLIVPGLSGPPVFASFISKNKEIATGDGKQAVIFIPGEKEALKKRTISANRAVVSIDDGKIAIAPSRGSVELLKMQDLSTLVSLGPSWESVSSLLFGFESRFLAAGYKSGMVRVFYLKAKDQVFRRGKPGVPVNGLALIAKKGILAFGNEHGQVRLWSLAQGVELKSLDAAGPVTGLVSSRDSRWLAAGMEDGRIALWDGEEGWARYYIKAFTDQVNALAFSPVDNVLAAVGRDKRLALYRIGPPEENSDLEKLSSSDFLEKAMSASGLVFDLEKQGLVPARPHPELAFASRAHGN